MPAFSLPTHPRSVAAVQPWFEQLPVRTRRLVMAGAIAMALIVGLSIVRWYRHAQPMYALEMCSGIRSTADVQEREAYLTPQGKAIMLWLLKKQGDKPADHEQMVFEAPIATGNTCDVPWRVGDRTGTIRLLKSDHWRVHDVYYEQSAGKRFELWASYLKDHPVGAWWKAYGDETIEAFFKGLVLGATAAR